MNLQLIQKTVGGAALLCASLIFASQALASRIIVAKSGGNYTTITAAMKAINPSATAPFVIEVWPGVYTEPGTVNLKSYVHIKGSGRDVTTIKTTTGNVINGVNVTNVAISGITVTNSLNLIGLHYGVNIRIGSNITIQDITVTNTRGGIIVEDVSNAIITGNRLVANYYQGAWIDNISGIISNNIITGNIGRSSRNSDFGIILIGPYTIGGRLMVSGNIISDNAGDGVAVYYDHANVVITNNTIVNNTLSGIMHRGIGGKFINNVITGNGATHMDVEAYSSRLGEDGAGANFVSNIFDDISGSPFVGSFNVNSNGDLILVP